MLTSSGASKAAVSMLHDYEVRLTANSNERSSPANEQETEGS
jgi:hypothetical protein